MASPPGIANLLDLTGFLEQTRPYKASTDEVNRVSSGGRQNMSEPRILIDPYFEWAQNEGIPVNEGFGFDLLHMDVKPWSRLGVNGAIALVAGRGDF